MTDLDVQVMAILADNNVSEQPFSDSVMSCLPTSNNIELSTTAELKDRRDYTVQRMFTIDPVGSNGMFLFFVVVVVLQSISFWKRLVTEYDHWLLFLFLY